jgi:hypothetical protein
MASVPFCPRCGTLLELPESNPIVCSGCKYSCNFEGEPALLAAVPPALRLVACRPQRARPDVRDALQAEGAPCVAASALGPCGRRGGQVCPGCRGRDLPQVLAHANVLLHDADAFGGRRADGVLRVSKVWAQLLGQCLASDCLGCEMSFRGVVSGQVTQELHGIVDLHEDHRGPVAAGVGHTVPGEGHHPSWAINGRVSRLP